MTCSRVAGSVSTIALGLLLAGCEGVNSTPTPTPAPAPTYQTLSQIAAQGSDVSFMTGGVKYGSSAAGYSGAETQAFGSGVKVDYQASTGKYTLTAPNGDTSAFFDPGDVVSTNPPGTIRFSSGNASLTLARPEVAGVQLSYTLLGGWIQNIGGESAVVRLAVGGVPTFKSDMPVTGSATYDMVVGGSATGAGGIFPATA